MTYGEYMKNKIHTNGNGKVHNNGSGKTKKEEFLPKSKKIYVEGKLYNDIKVPFREIELTPTKQPDGKMEVNPPMTVYDTSGEWGDENKSCDVKQGLPLIRLKWIKDRNDVEEYEGRTVKPVDNGYSSNEDMSIARNNEKWKLEYFPGLRRKPLKAKNGGAV